MLDATKRPVCHRAEDLVSYLYGEASDREAHDFRSHLRQCESCRAELAVFNIVHNDIALWRQEILGGAPQQAPAMTTAERPSGRLSAVAALREFFTVSPLWLRAVTAFSALLLFVLAGMAVTRLWQRPPQVAQSGDQKAFSRADVDAAVAQAVKAERENTTQTALAASKEPPVIQKPSPRREAAAVSKTVKPHVKALTREERQQLAADLRLIPSDDEELPLTPEEPNH